MDFSAVCHLTLMARPFLQKKPKNQKTKQKQTTSNNSSFAREQQFYFIRQFCARLDDKELKHIDENYFIYEKMHLNNKYS